MEQRHQLPNVQLGGLNVEEKETRHDLDKRMNRGSDSRNKSSEKCKAVHE